MQLCDIIVPNGELGRWTSPRLEWKIITPDWLLSKHSYFRICYWTTLPIILWHFINMLFYEDTRFVWVPLKLLKHELVKWDSADKADHKPLFSSAHVLIGILEASRSQCANHRLTLGSYSEDHSKDAHGMYSHRLITTWKDGATNRL